MEVLFLTEMDILGKKTSSLTEKYLPVKIIIFIFDAVCYLKMQAAYSSSSFV